MQPLVPGFTITGALCSSATGSSWSAVRTLDDHGFHLKIVSVADLTQALAKAAQVTAQLHRIRNEHLVRQHSAIGLADGTLALVLDQVTGGSLAKVLGTWGQLTPGETVTIVAPLFGALADLHASAFVHGDLAPAGVLFSADGKPLVSELGMARLLKRDDASPDATSGFTAPELVAGAVPSPASDVYAMAAIGWFCLTGAPPASPATRPSLTTLRPEIPPRLVEVLSSCLCPDPGQRPSAATAAVEVFDAAPAESVRLATAVDPATEITRRIRAAAISAPVLRASSDRRRRPSTVVIGVAVLVAALAVGGVATWFLRREPASVGSMAHSVPTPPRPTPTVNTSKIVPPSAAPQGSKILADATRTSPAARRQNMADVVTASDSPRRAPAGLLQALVDTRALAYVARNAALLDLVYAPEATKASVDRDNIATALKNKATYLGLIFVIKDAEFLDGTSESARIRATIVTPAYETGQRDGRRISHPKDTVKASVFTLKLTPVGWRVLGLAAH